MPYNWVETSLICTKIHSEYVHLDSYINIISFCKESFFSLKKLAHLKFQFIFWKSLELLDKKAF